MSSCSVLSLRQSINRYLLVSEHQWSCFFFPLSVSYAILETSELSRVSFPPVHIRNHWFLSRVIWPDVNIRCCFTLQWRLFLSAIITCDMNSIILLVVNTVCELFSWRMYFFVCTILLLFLNCLQVCCQSIVIMWMLWHFSANQISFTWLLRVSWLVLERLSKCCLSQRAYFNLISNRSLWNYSRSSGKKHWWMLGLEQTIRSQTRALETRVIISGNRRAPENPTSTLAHATWRLCFWEWRLRCFS